VFDKVAAKIKGISSAAKSFEGIKPLGNMGWGPKFQKDIEALQVSGRELAKIQNHWAGFNTAMARNGPVRASQYFGAVDQWKNQTLGNLRQVRTGLDETEKHQNRFFKKAGNFALIAGGAGAGAYAAGRGIHAVVKTSADRERELARYDLGGLSEGEKSEAMAKANEISGKYPSVGRTEVLGHIRQLRARLGDFHHAIDNVETLTKAQVMLSTLGQGENAPEDLEKLVLGLESQGIGSQPEKFKTYLNAFVKAKSLCPDLKGEDFQTYMRRANASKYALSEDYLTNVAPMMMQHEGAANFGTEQSSAFSALIGRRQTKTAKAAMRSYGLLDENGDLIDEKGFISNPYNWTKGHVKSALANKGMPMDEEHKDDIVKAVTQMFSNRKVGEYITSMLINEAVIEKDRELLKHAKGTEGAEQARREDPYVAWGGLTTQIKDTTAALVGLKSTISAMEYWTDAFRKAGDYLRTGKLPEGSPGKALQDVSTSPFDPAEMNRREGMTRQQTEADERIRQVEAAGGGNDAATRRLRMKAFELRMGLDASNAYASRGLLFGEKEIKQWQDADQKVPLPMADPRRMRGGDRIPFPMSDPRKTGGGDMPPVQSLEGATVQAALTGSAEVHGEVTGRFEVVPGSAFLSMVESVQQMKIAVQGMLNANGPGSTGKSSPDAAAPSPKGNTGASGGW
jgi:hypothetical protein